MEDHRSEDYVKPKVTIKAFSGAGHMLGRYGLTRFNIITSFLYEIIMRKMFKS